MKYDFGEGYAKEHTIILTVPGQTKGLEDTTSYSLVQEGEHTIYVRCEDAAGNGEASSPFTIKLNVKKTPDTIAPLVTEFVPASGSAVKFNTTSKLVKFKLDQPAECRWDLNDVRFDIMNNSFDCDETPSENGMINGYYCSGILAGITSNLSLQTRYYIRCKDQPWLEGIEDNLYKRNTNTRSYDYILKPSSELKIIETTPVESLSVNANNISFILKAITSGGGFNGKARCYWRLGANSNLSGKSYTKFFTTDSSSHSQLIGANLTGGLYYYQIKCEDNSENSAIVLKNFNLIIDTSNPFVRKIYWKANNLFVRTNEDAVCYYSMNDKTKCNFNFNDANITMMAGVEKEHTAGWKNDKTYYIKCKDYYGNYNTDCIIAARTY
jgi:hypothetical protein